MDGQDLEFEVGGSGKIGRGSSFAPRLHKRNLKAFFLPAWLSLCGPKLVLKDLSLTAGDRDTFARVLSIAAREMVMGALDRLRGPRSSNRGLRCKSGVLKSCGFEIPNFGLAESKSGCNAITMHIVGTQDYIPPEYLFDGIVSMRMDMFLSEIILLELVLRREAMDKERRVMWAGVVKAFEGHSND
ncbi:hypothetical protein NL676_021091 [Syzygium grande]|nr:hypothetical protein NL676_021091 [Syzygium grande]